MNNVCDYCSNRVLSQKKVSFKFCFFRSLSDLVLYRPCTESICESEGRDMAIKYATVQFFFFSFFFFLLCGYVGDGQGWFCRNNNNNKIFQEEHDDEHITFTFHHKLKTQSGRAFSELKFPQNCIDKFNLPYVIYDSDNNNFKSSWRLEV